MAVSTQRWPCYAAGLSMPLTVNLIGCLAVGLLTGLAQSRDLLTPGLRLFLVVGLLGGLTTISAFGLEIFGILRGAEIFKAFASVVAHLVLGLAAVAVGFWVGR